MDGQLDSYQQKKFRAFQEFLIRYNPDPKTCFFMSDFFVKWFEYKQALASGINENTLRQMEEYKEFRRIMKGLES